MCHHLSYDGCGFEDDGGLFAEYWTMMCQGWEDDGLLQPRTEQQPSTISMSVIYGTQSDKLQTDLICVHD